VTFIKEKIRQQDLLVGKQVVPQNKENLLEKWHHI
jgi:hypothetical protein